MARKKGSRTYEESRKPADGRYKDPLEGFKAKQTRAFKSTTQKMKRAFNREMGLRSP